jgi:hypothetical protein
VTDLGIKLRYLWQGVRATRGRAVVVPCRTPLVLISQVQRSGGTLLSQLFDDHPEIFAHPHELDWGRPNRWDWPDFKDVPSTSAREFWQRLHGGFVDKAIQRGYQKGVYSKSLPFLFDRLMQWRLFRDAIAAGVSTQRDVFDAYMTSFFNAWLDYQNLYRAPKRYTVAFTPRVNMFPEYVDRFFRDYPDGRMVSIVRDPLSWFASAKRHARSRHDMRDKSLENLMPFWSESADRALANRERHGSRCIVLRFSDLVERTAGLMHALAGALGVAFNETLLSPTFNGLPIGSNTSHEEISDQPGVVVSSTLDHYRGVLERSDIEAIEARFGALYDRAAAAALDPA